MTKNQALLKKNRRRKNRPRKKKATKKTQMFQGRQKPQSNLHEFETVEFTMIVDISTENPNPNRSH